MQITTFVFISVIFLLTPKKLSATHISSGNFEFTCLGGDTFLVRLHLLRDCNGVSMPLTINATTTSFGNCGPAARIDPWVRDSVKEVSRLCPSMASQSTCSNGTFAGVQHGYFSARYVMPECDSGHYEFVYGICCRNSTGNLVGQPVLAIEAEFKNSSATACNNSPRFSENPIPFVCVDQPVNFNWGVNEYDGDSLYFYLGELYSFSPASGLSPVAFQSGYSYTNPFPVPVHLDAQTGQISFYPNSAMQGLFWAVKICVDEYRDGIYLSTLCREIGINVIQCDN